MRHRLSATTLVLLIALSGCTDGEPSKPQETTRTIDLNAPKVRVQLEPSESGVRGRVIFRARDDGTNVNLRVRGLEPGSDARAAVNAGTCTKPGASFLELPGLKANDKGIAKAEGRLRYRGRQNIKLTEVADGKHIVRIFNQTTPLACGAIPVPKKKRARPQPLVSPTPQS